MALPASGPISFSDLQTEYGDSGSISMSELYKDGGSIGVVSTVLEIGAWNPTSGEYQYYFGAGSGSPPGGNYFWGQAQSGSGFVNATWANSSRISGLPAGSTIGVGGGFQYQRMTFFISDGGSNFWGIRRRSYADVPVNQNVPTSGTITLADFYGGRGS